MARPTVNDDRIMLKLPRDLTLRADDVINKPETRSAFIRQAMEREIKRRARANPGV